MRYHLIGIKGMGMAGLATILRKQGHEVQGSDVNKELATQDALIKEGIKIIEFNQVDFFNIDIVIYGHSFINHQETKIARVLCEVYEYHEFLNNIIKQHQTSIAISGSHGKTTCTGLITSVCDSLIGVSGLVGDGTGYYNNRQELFIFEACEYLRHFLIYRPNIAVILNIDYDHVDYFKNSADYILAYQQFLDRTYDVAIINNDDINSAKLKTSHLKKITFGINNNSDYMAKNLILKDTGYQYDLYINSQYSITIMSSIFSKHEIYSYLVLFSLKDYLKIDEKNLINQLDKFNGVKRRFSETIFNGDIYIDDYAHHPRQIEATLEKVANKYPDHEIIAIFQPDRYSRILQFFKEIAAAMMGAGQAYVLDFPSTISNDTDSDFDASIIANEDPTRIKMLKDVNQIVLQKNQKYVFIQMSSKTIVDVFNKLKEKRGKFDNI